MTVPQPLPKRLAHRVRSGTSRYNSKWLIVSFRSPSYCLHLLPRLPVTSTFLYILPSLKYFRRQFLRKMPGMETKMSFLI